MKTKSRIFGQVSGFFGSSRPVDRQLGPGIPETSTGVNTDKDNSHSIKIQNEIGPRNQFLSWRNGLPKQKECNQIIPSETPGQICCNTELDDDPRSGNLCALERHGSIKSLKDPNPSLYPSLTYPRFPEIQVDPQRESYPLTPKKSDMPFLFRYSVATSKIPLDALFKLPHFRSDKSLWNSLVVPCNLSSKKYDPRFDVQIVLPLPLGHANSGSRVDQAMQVGVYYCQRAILTSRSSYFRNLISGGASRQSTNIDVITFRSPPFSVETLKIALHFLYETPDKDLLDLQLTCGDIVCSEPFLLYTAAHALALPSLVEWVSHKLIVEKMLHRTPSDIFVDPTERNHSMRTHWKQPNEKPVCCCLHCADSAAKVLCFCSENDIKDDFLECAAKQTLIESFGTGWCADEFTSLPLDATESISAELLDIISPDNSLSLFFATEEALSTLDQSPCSPSSESTRRLLETTRTRIEGIISEAPEECFRSSEWLDTVLNSCNSPEEMGQDKLLKLEWIYDALYRARDNMCQGTENWDYLENLCHIVAERLTTTSRCPSASVESLAYSRASSRTASTDYGLSYTHFECSPPPSLSKRRSLSLTSTSNPISPVSRKLPCVLSSVISPNANCGSSSFVFQRTQEPCVLDSKLDTSSNSPKLESSSITARLRSGQVPPAEQLPGYSTVFQRRAPINKGSEKRNGSQMSVRIHDGILVNDGMLLKQEIAMLKSTNCLLRTALFKSQAILQDAFDRLEAPIIGTDEEKHPQDADVHRAETLQQFGPTSQPVTKEEMVEDIYQEDNISINSPEPFAKVVESQNSEISARIDEKGNVDRINDYEPTSSHGVNVEVFDEDFGLKQDAMSLDDKTSTELEDQHQHDNHEDQNTVDLSISRSGQLQAPDSENSMLGSIKGVESGRLGLPEHVETTEEDLRTVHSTNTQENPCFQPSFDDNLEKGFPKSGIDQLADYLDFFYDQLSQYRSACEAQLIRLQKGKMCGHSMSGSRTQEALQQKELLEKVDNIIWKIKEGRKNLIGVIKIPDNQSPNWEKHDHTGIPLAWRAEDQKLGWPKGHLYPFCTRPFTQDIDWHDKKMALSQ